MPRLGVIGYDETTKKFSVRVYAQGVKTFDDASSAVRYAATGGRLVAVNQEMPVEAMIKVTASAIFERIQLHDLQGKLITGTPVPDAKVRYVTSKEVGKLIPDGWMIECQLGTYAACFGEELTLPARSSMALAITDIRSFLAASIQQSSSELSASYAQELHQSKMDLL